MVSYDNASYIARIKHIVQEGTVDLKQNSIDNYLLLYLYIHIVN